MLALCQPRRDIVLTKYLQPGNAQLARSMRLPSQRYLGCSPESRSRPCHTGHSKLAPSLATKFVGLLESVVRDWRQCSTTSVKAYWGNHDSELLMGICADINDIVFELRLICHCIVLVLPKERKGTTEGRMCRQRILSSEFKHL